MILVGAAVASYLSPLFYIILVAWLGIIHVEGLGVSVWNSDLLILWLVLAAASLYLVAERASQKLAWEGADFVLGLADGRFTTFLPDGQRHHRLETFLQATEIDVVMRYARFGMTPVSRLIVVLVIVSFSLIGVPGLYHFSYAETGVTYAASDMLLVTSLVLYISSGLGGYFSNRDIRRYLTGAR